jgi:hypothetical protein
LHHAARLGLGCSFFIETVVGSGQKFELVSSRLAIGDALKKACDYVVWIHSDSRPQASSTLTSTSLPTLTHFQIRALWAEERHSVHYTSVPKTGGEKFPMSIGCHYHHGDYIVWIHSGSRPQASSNLTSPSLLTLTHLWIRAPWTEERHSVHYTSVPDVNRRREVSITCHYHRGNELRH